MGSLRGSLGLLLVLVLLAPSCGGGGGGGGGPQDTTAPAAVLDLRIIDVTSTTLTIKWTATGDDGNIGTASSYSLRYSTTPITTGNWLLATPVAGTPAPTAAGSTQTFTITGLPTPTLYYVAIKVLDEVSNISDLSNVCQGDVRFKPGVAFIADKDSAGTKELYVADLAGTTVLKVSGALVAGGNVLDFQWSPDRSLLAFTADKDTAAQIEVYAVSPWGGAPWKVSGALAPGGTCVTTLYSWSPDGTRIAYSAKHDSPSALELYTSLSTGGGNVKISGPMTPGGNLINIGVWSPDSTRMAYIADQDIVGKWHLYLSSADGSVKTKVYPTTPSSDQVFGWRFSPDGAWLGFSAGLTLSSPQDIYTTHPDGTGLVKTTGPFQPNASLDGWLWAPDSSRILFVSDMDVDQQIEAYTVTPGVAASHVKISGTMVGGGYVQFYKWSPDSSCVAFRAYQYGTNHQEVFVGQADGSGRVTVNGPMVAGGHAQDFSWSPDGSRLAYTADQDTDGVIELYTSTPTGASNTKVSGAQLGASNLYPYMDQYPWAPDGSRLVYSDDQQIDNRVDFYTSVPTTAVGNVRVSPVPVAGGNVVNGSYQWTADSQHIVYLGDLTTDGVNELYRTDAASAAGNLKLSGTLVGGGQVVSFQLR